MYFDWITWSIFLVGFIILVIWIIIPVKEFRKLLQNKNQEMKNQAKKKKGEKN